MPYNKNSHAIELHNTNADLFSSIQKAVESRDGVLQPFFVTDARQEAKENLHLVRGWSVGPSGYLTRKNTKFLLKQQLAQMLGTASA